MNDQEHNPYLSPSPSFRTDSILVVDHDHDRNPNDESDVEFEFSVNTTFPLTDAADEVFSNGRVLPVYPVFNRNLLLDSDPHPNLDQMRSLFISDPVDFRSGSISSTSSSDSVEIEGSYCKWTPKSAPQSPERRWKSAPTGSRSGSGSGSGWRIRDLVGGRRSKSDGNEKLRLFKHADSGLKAKVEEKTKEKKKKKEVKEMDMVTAHRLFYGKEKKEGRKSFLPYRVGLFSNSRAQHFHPL